jgi:hypothetical protein
VPVFERPQLLKAFGFFERTHRQRRIPQQEFALIYVEPNMFEMNLSALRNRRARKVKGETAQIGDDFYYVRIIDLVRILGALTQVAGRIRIVEHWQDRGVDGGWIDRSSSLR